MKLFAHVTVLSLANISYMYYMTVLQYIVHTQHMYMQWNNYSKCAVTKITKYTCARYLQTIFTTSKRISNDLMGCSQLEQYTEL